MAFFGLDIGSYAIKVVKAEGGGAAKIREVGAIYNPVGQVLPSDPNHFQQLATAIKGVLRDRSLGGLACHLSVSGLQAYVSIVSMPVLTDAELASAIKWEAEQHIPVSLDEVNFEYDVVWRPQRGSSEKMMKVFLVGVPKTVVERYLELLRMVGIEAIGLEPEVVSLVRTFFGTSLKDKGVTTLICNLGALASSFVVVDEGKIEVAHSASVGSMSLTRALERGFSLEARQAEEYKRTYGLDADQLEGKVRAALVPVFEPQVAEIRKTMQFYASKTQGKQQVKRLLLSGGGANLPNLAVYLAEVLSVEVVVGDPFSKVDVTKVKNVPNDRASYGVAVGLATKEF